MSEDPPPFEGTTQGATAEQSIMVLVEHRPEIVLLQPESREKLFEAIENEIAAFEPDLSTDTSRKAIAAMAFKVTRTKTAIEAARLRLTEEAREKIKAVNAEGAPIKERLETLAKQVRAPLTEWEAAEEKREAECKAGLERLRQAAIVPMNATADSLRTRITEVESEPMHEDRWRGMSELAEKAKATALEALNAALAIVEQKERDATELAALREQAEQRRLADEAREAREREEVAAREQEQREVAAAEQRRKDEEEAAARTEREHEAEAERARIASEQAATAAAESARAEEARRAADQAAERERAHEAELQAANARAAEIERRAEAERAEREAAERQRALRETAAAQERARLEADQARRRQVKADAKDAIMSCGADEETAKKIVLAILAGEIPRVILDFSAEPPGAKKPATPVPSALADARDNRQDTLV